MECILIGCHKRITWGCGQDSLPEIKSIAASITAAPFNMVAIKISCPGQSTKDTCLSWTRRNKEVHYGDV